MDFSDDSAASEKCASEKSMNELIHQSILDRTNCDCFERQNGASAMPFKSDGSKFDRGCLPHPVELEMNYDCDKKFPRKVKFDCDDPRYLNEPAWDYLEKSPVGPKKWYKKCNRCLKNNQSPIDLIQDNAIFVSYEDYPEFNLYNWNATPRKVLLENSHHAIRLYFEWPDDKKPMITRGPPDLTLYLNHLCYHWGSEDKFGSEHKLNGKNSPMEVQMYFYNAIYKDFEYAVNRQNGLVVISYLFQIYEGNSKSNCFPFIQYLRYVYRPELNVTIIDTKGFTLLDMFGFLNENFFMYHGSMTTPPCHDNVDWLVADKLLYIKREELLEFRKLVDYFDEKLVDNFRPLQPVGDRRIYFFGRYPFTKYNQEYYKRHKWSYDDKDDSLKPKDWYLSYPAAKGEYQSPINVTRNTCAIMEQYNLMNGDGFDEIPIKVLLKNTGRTLEIWFDWDKIVPKIRGGPLQGDYNLSHINYHWGNKRNIGSEHSINGEFCPMEGHYFFKSMDKHKPGYMDTFAVIARLYKIKEQFKTNSNPHAKFLSEVEQPGSVFEVPSIHHERFRLGQLLGNLAWPFIHYKGSLTYPPCLETYDWMVSLNHLNVGIAELKAFRSLKNTIGEPLVNNYRPIQDKHQRILTLYKFFKPEVAKELSPSVTPYPIHCPKEEANSKH